MGAQRRARRRGVDLMEIQPRRLLTPQRRMRTDPVRQIHRAWTRTGSAMSRAMESMAPR